MYYRTCYTGMFQTCSKTVKNLNNKKPLDGKIMWHNILFVIIRIKR